jgi:NADH:ubiquinone oxidoreductase subunit 6 (subunit J)
VPLIGALPQPITSAPLVFFVYLVLILLIGSALATVLLRNTLYAVGAFAASMVLLALLYLAIAPFLLVALQLLVFTTMSAVLLIGLLRATTGLRTSSVGRLSPEWIIGAAVSAVMFALLALVMGATSWPVQVCCSFPEDLGRVLGNSYVVGLAVLAVILGSAALGSGLMLAGPTLPSGRGERSGRR